MIQSNDKDSNELLSFGGHLEVLRKLLFRVLAIVICVTIVVFAFKDTTFNILLAPSEWNFITYQWIERIVNVASADFHFEPFSVELIATDLSSQFMTHLTMALYLGVLVASPYIIYELFKFVSPALYENEKKYSKKIICIVYTLFILGVFMSYFILFPISFRFLGTYSVAEKVHSTITLDSYISTFNTLTLMMGIVFQLPVIAYVLAKLGVISSGVMARYRTYAFLIIMLVSAVITPPDIMTMLLVGIPLYLLYEISIKIVRKTTNKGQADLHDNNVNEVSRTEV